MLPMYIIDPDDYKRRSRYGYQRVGGHRAAFLKGCVVGVRRALRSCRSDLVVRYGVLEEELVEAVAVLRGVLGRRDGVDGKGEVVLVGVREVGWEEGVWERKVERIVRREGGKVVWVDGGRLCWVKEEWLSFRSEKGVVRSFTEYRKVVEGNAVFEEPLDVPDLPAVPRKGGIAPVLETLEELPFMGEDLGVEGMCAPHDYPFPDPKAVMGFKGGCENAEDRVDDWMWELDMLKVYKETRNFSGERDCSSKLSPWLSTGCISPRTLLQHIVKYEKERTKNESTYWLVFELITRDYFKWLADKAGSSLFAWNGFAREEPPQFDLPPGFKITEVHRKRLQAWIDGMTGSPFVDAAMRELKATGYTSNRSRQNVASFLIQDLNFPDWRAGAEYFESMLIDHDIAANYGNWAYIAGVGSDPRGGRRFNIVKQAHEYDAEGKFVAKWCPELHRIPVPFIFEPHTLSAEKLQEFDVQLGKDYPKPIVQLQTWKPRAKASSSRG